MPPQHLLPLMIIVIVAFLAPLVSLRIRRLRVPAIILEIALGIVLGRSVLGWVESSPVIDFLAEFGFIFLMFLSGYELDFGMLRRMGTRRRSTWALPFGMFALTLAGSLGCSLILGPSVLGLVKDPWLFALILSTTSVGIVLPTLKQRGEISSRYGQMLVLTALVADLASIVLLTIYVIYFSEGMAWKMALVGVVGVTFALAWWAGRLVRRGRVLGAVLEELEHASTQIKVRGALAVLVVFVVMAEAFGTEAILAAFLAGALMSALSGRSRQVQAAKLDALGYGFFIPIFFIMVGVELDLPSLFVDVRAALLVPLLLLFAFAVKLLPASLLRVMFGTRDTVAGGFLLASRLALIIAASEIALSIGAISPTVNAAVVLTAIVTCLVSPAIYGRIRGEPTVSKPRVVIAGAGRIGREVVRRLQRHGLEVAVIEWHSDQAEKLDPTDSQKALAEYGADPGTHVVVGDVRNPAILRKVGLKSHDVFVALTGVDELNLAACLIATSEFGVTRAIARDNNPANAQRFRDQGVEPLGLRSSVASELENLVLRPTLANLLSDPDSEVFAFEVDLTDPDLFDLRVQDLPGLGEARLVVVKRDEDTFIPRGRTRLREGDCIVLVGTADDEARLRDAL